MPSNRRGAGGSAAWLWTLGLIVVVGLLARGFGLWPGGSGGARDAEVVIYAAQDQVYAEPILREFEARTGIRVKAVYDSEAVKTVGLANRLLAERAHPRCDVFWGNEELRTRQLASREIFRETNGWAAFGHRSRRFAIRGGSGDSTSVAAPAPLTLGELTQARYRGGLVLAHPLFGSTATHFLVLRAHWGEARWLEWCRALAANQPILADGNSGAVRFLGRGDARLAWTDSDDIAAWNREATGDGGGAGAGLLVALPLGAESLLLPNTVAVIRGAPNPGAAQRLFEYLQSPAVTARLVDVGALESSASPETVSGVLRPDWPAVLRDLDRATEQLQEIFRR